MGDAVNIFNWIITLIWEFSPVAGAIVFGILLGAEKRKKKILSPGYNNSRLITYRVLFYVCLGIKILEVSVLLIMVGVLAKFMASM